MPALIVIEPDLYRVDPEARKLADEVMAAAGLDPNDVTRIEGTPPQFRCCVADVVDGELAEHWVDVTVGGA